MQNNTLDYILKKFDINLDDHQRMPIEIRNFDREGLTHLFHELDFKKGIEIGVRDGGYSEMIMKNNPQLEKMYGVDPYEPHVGYRDHVRRSTFNAFLEQAHAKLDKYPNYAFIKDYSHNAIKLIDDNSLDFVYIDGDHSFYQATYDIEFWKRKIRPGGIISGDDYFKHKGMALIHVYQVVSAYCDAYKIRPWFVLGSNEIVEGEKRDHGRSWMWVK